MNSPRSPPGSGTCSRCGECCRWLPVILIRQCKPHQIQYFRERGLVEADGFFLADVPCPHLQRGEPDENGIAQWSCAIYDRRPATCRDFSGRSLSSGKRYYVPAGCTMAAGRSRKSGDENP